MPETNEDQPFSREWLLKALVGDNRYVLIEIQTEEGAEESTARVSTDLAQEIVGDVLFGILSQLNQ